MKTRADQLRAFVQEKDIECEPTTRGSLDGLRSTAIATLDELSDGRAVLGLRAGGTNHRALGITREAPAVALREAVKLIRGLLAGRRMTVDGRMIHAFDAKLDFVPARSDPPIYVGARGPRVLQLANASAGGVIVGKVATPEGWSYALEQIGKGSRLARRDLSEIGLTAWLYVSVSDGASGARTIRAMVATSLVTSRPIPGELGIEIPADFSQFMSAGDWSVARGVTTDGGRMLTKDLPSRLGIAGTPRECRQQLSTLLAAFPQISQLMVLPLASAGQQLLNTVRRFKSEVADELAAPGSASSDRHKH